jgi:hypothetical protein
MTDTPVTSPLNARSATRTADGGESVAVRGPSRIIFTIIIFAFLVLPAAVFYTFTTSSQAPGLVIASVITIGFAFFGALHIRLDARFLNGLLLMAVIFILLLTHGLIARYIQENDVGRMVTSIGTLAVCGVAAIIVSDNLFGADDDKLRFATTTLLVCLAFVAFFGFLGIRPYNPGINAPNPIFPFTEPSHYALVITPLALAVAARLHGSRRVLVIIGLLLAAYLIRSMSLVVGIAVIAAVCLPMRLLVPSLIGLGFLSQTLDLDYFAQRSDFSVNNTNLSNLVYLQGWELTFDSLRRTGGWGLGLQQLGIGLYSSPVADIVFRLVGNDINIREGSFTFAKLVSELGVFGFLMMVAYLVIAARCGWWLRRYAAGTVNGTVGEALARAFIG